MRKLLAPVPVLLAQARTPRVHLAMNNSKELPLLFPSRPASYDSFPLLHNFRDTAFEPEPRPFGVGFTGTACSEPRLVELAYAFEQATLRRVSPPGLQ